MSHAEFKISKGERDALQSLINGKTAMQAVAPVVRTELYRRGWLTFQYELSETGRTVARQLGITKQD